MSGLGWRQPGRLPERLVESLVIARVLALGLVLLVLSPKLDHLGAHPVAVLLEKIGEAVLIVGLLHLVYEAMLRKSFLELVAAALSSVVEDLWELYSALRTLGILMVYRDLPTELLLVAIRQSHSVRILKTWPPDALLEAVLPLLSPTQTLEVSLCDPYADILRLRSLGASAIPTEGRRRTLLFLHRLKQLLRQNPNLQVTVKLFHAWPGVPTIQCDNQLFFGFYLRGLCSLFAPWFRVDPERELGRMVRNQFDSFADDEITATLKTAAEIDTWLRDRHSARPPKKAPMTAA